MTAQDHSHPLQGLLIDVDGVLRIGAEPIAGASEALASLRLRGMPFRLVTNVTRKSRAEEAGRLRDMGIEVGPAEIYTASAIAAEYLRRQGARRCWLLTEGRAHEDFHGLELTDQDPQYVVLGDLGDDFRAMLLHRAFRALLAGARLIAIQRNAAWTADDGLPRLDVGAWVAALEYASGQTAQVMGKPARFAYELPAEDLGVPPGHLGMVADDPDVDLAGAPRRCLAGARRGPTSSITSSTPSPTCRPCWKYWNTRTETPWPSLNRTPRRGPNAGPSVRRRRPPTCRRSAICLR